MRLRLLVSAALLVICVPALCAAQPGRPLPHRWVYIAQNLQVNENVPKVEAIMRRAAKAGYTGIVLADYKLSILDRVPDFYFRNAQQVIATAKELNLELVPCVFDIGYSAGILAHDPNLVEGMPVRDAPFVVRDGKADLAQDPATAITNGGFEEASGDKPAGWAWQDDPGKITFIDRETKHSGQASLRIEPKGANARIVRNLKLTPNRCYHLSFWIKTRDLDNPGGANVAIIPPGKDARSLCFPSLGLASTQDWKLYEIVFNSQAATEASAYIGVWGGKGGALWLDDVKLEELGLVNVVRRKGCPLVVRGEDGTTYEEGRDFETVSDPKLGNVPWAGSFELSHEAPSIVLTKGSRIREGQRLKVSFYHPAFVYDMQTCCCLTEPKVYDVLRDQMQRVEKLFHPTAVMMSHDEIRVANWCELCQGQHKTPGQILADNVRRCEAIVREVSPKARIYVWSDMFDPYHNAHDNYYLVNGTWAGSWEGLTPDVGIVNWYFEARKQNLPWFSKRGHRQILAGYYDNNADYTRQWLEDGKGVPGIEGVMYTTWQGRYDDLERFAQVVWGQPK